MDKAPLRFIYPHHTSLHSPEIKHVAHLSPWRVPLAFWWSSRGIFFSRTLSPQPLSSSWTGCCSLVRPGSFICPNGRRDVWFHRLWVAAEISGLQLLPVSQGNFGSRLEATRERRMILKVTLWMLLNSIPGATPWRKGITRCKQY